MCAGNARTLTCPWRVGCRPGCSRGGRASPWTPVASAATDNAPYRLGRLTDETACPIWTASVTIGQSQQPRRRIRCGLHGDPSTYRDRYQPLAPTPG